MRMKENHMLNGTHQAPGSWKTEEPGIQGRYRHSTFLLLSGLSIPVSFLIILPPLIPIFYLNRKRTSAPGRELHHICTETKQQKGYTQTEWHFLDFRRKQFKEKYAEKVGGHSICAQKIITKIIGDKKRRSSPKNKYWIVRFLRASSFCIKRAENAH